MYLPSTTSPIIEKTALVAGCLVDLKADQQIFVSYKCQACVYHLSTWIIAHARPFRFYQKLKAGEAGNKAMCKHCLCLDPDTVYLSVSLSIEEHYLAIKFINSLILLEIPTVHVGSPSHSLLFKIS